MAYTVNGTVWKSRWERLWAHILLAHSEALITFEKWAAR